MKSCKKSCNVQNPETRMATSVSGCEIFKKLQKKLQNGLFKEKSSFWPQSVRPKNPPSFSTKNDGKDPWRRKKLK